MQHFDTSNSDKPKMLRIAKWVNANLRNAHMGIAKLINGTMMNAKTIISKLRIASMTDETEQCKT